jgi:hypothetical protein
MSETPRLRLGGPSNSSTATTAGTRSGALVSSPTPTSSNSRGGGRNSRSASSPSPKRRRVGGGHGRGGAGPASAAALAAGLLAAAPGSPVSARQRAAAAAIQRAFRAFRRRFPEGGRVFSRSSTSPAVYQEEPNFRDRLAAALSDQLVALAGMSPAAREAHVAAGRARLGLGPVLPPGFVRAAPLPDGRPGFVDARWVAAWAQQGYRDAAQRAGRTAIVELPLDQVDFALGYVQAEAAAMAAAAESKARVRLLRTVAERRSPGTVRAGMQAMRRYAALEEPGPAAGVVVGGPGDRFRLTRDMRRFLHEALGGLARYRWAMNPRRRRRVAGRPPRWVMSVNFGVRFEELYRWLRLMYGLHTTMAPARNWSHLYPRPLGMYDEKGAVGKQLRSSVRDLLLRYLLEDRRTFGSTRSRYMGLSRTDPTRPTPPVLRDRKSFGTPHAAGLVTGGDPHQRDLHTGLFMAAVTPIAAAGGPGGGLARRKLVVAVLDPHGVPSFTAHEIRTLRRAFSAGLRDLGMDGAIELEVGPVDVGAALALQHSFEGSCSPSSVALLMSVLREMRANGARSELATWRSRSGSGSRSASGSRARSASGSRSSGLLPPSSSRSSGLLPPSRSASGSGSRAGSGSGSRSSGLLPPSPAASAPRSEPLFASLPGMADIAYDAFWRVNDEDVVMAAQLSHNFAARPRQPAA